MDCHPPAPLSMGFPREAYWHGLPFPSPVDLPDPGIKPTSIMLLHSFHSMSSNAAQELGFTWGQSALGIIAWTEQREAPEYSEQKERGSQSHHPSGLRIEARIHKIGTGEKNEGVDDIRTTHIHILKSKTEMRDWTCGQAVARPRIKIGLWATASSKLPRKPVLICKDLPKRQRLEVRPAGSPMAVLRSHPGSQTRASVIISPKWSGLN